MDLKSVIVSAELTLEVDTNLYKPRPMDKCVFKDFLKLK